jgi:hypothetical protein
MDVWKNFKFSVDLINCALNEILFLREVNNSQISCTNNDLIDRAIYRYEKVWLPFYSKNEDNKLKLSPPLDIEWIWHCHMLYHNEYKQDCLDMYGRILDHEVISNQERYNRENETYLIWSKLNLGVSFNYLDQMKSVDIIDYKDFNSNLRVNLKDIARRQLDFYYQVSLPHFQSIEYLNLGLDRYEKFLYMKKRNPHLFIVSIHFFIIF